MTIKKLGHSCMVIKEGEVTFITDPGSYTADMVKDLTGIDVILLSDEHQDHFHLPSIQALQKNNPTARILTQKAIHKLLSDQGIESELLLDKQKTEIRGVKVEGCGEKHALLHSSIPQSDNTGYIIADRFFYPGDNLTIPGKPIEILALPVGGPWLKMSEVIDYVLAVKPQVAFPVHDLMRDVTFMVAMINKVAEPQGIKIVMPEGEMEF